MVFQVVDNELREESTEDFGFRNLGAEEGFELVSKYDQLLIGGVNLFAISNLHDLFVVGDEQNGLIAGRLSDLRVAVQNRAELNSKVSHSIIRPKMIVFSSNEDAVCVVEEVSVKMLSTSKLLHTDASDLVLSTPDFSSPIADIEPNPTNGLEFLALDYSGSIYIIASSTNSKLLVTGNASCTSWVANGKNIVVGLNDGSIAVFNTSGSKLIDIGKSQDLTSDFIPISIRSLDMTRLIVVYSDKSAEHEYRVFIVQRDESANKYTWSVVVDPCPPYGDMNRQTKWYIQVIQGWSKKLPFLVSLVSAPSSDISLITDTYSISMLNDFDRASLPLSSEDEETSPVGVAIDISSSTMVKDPCPGVEGCPALPILWVLNSEGRISGWHIVWKPGVREGSAGIEELKSNLKQRANSDASAAERPVLSFQSAKESSTEGDDVGTPSSKLFSFAPKTEVRVSQRSSVFDSSTTARPPLFGTPTSTRSSLGASPSPFASQITSQSIFENKPSSSTSPAQIPEKPQTTSSYPTFGQPTLAKSPFSATSAFSTTSRQSSALESPSPQVAFGQSTFGSAKSADKSTFGTTSQPSAFSSQPAFGQSTFGSAKPAGGEKPNTISSTVDQAPFAGSSNTISPFSSGFGQFGSKPASFVTAGQISLGNQLFGQSSFGSMNSGQSVFGFSGAATVESVFHSRSSEERSLTEGQNESIFISKEENKNKRFELASTFQAKPSGFSDAAPTATGMRMGDLGLASITPGSEIMGDMSSEEEGIEERDVDEDEDKYNDDDEEPAQLKWRLPTTSASTSASAPPSLALEDHGEEGILNSVDDRSFEETKRADVSEEFLDLSDKPSNKILEDTALSEPKIEEPEVEAETSKARVGPSLFNKIDETPMLDVEDVSEEGVGHQNADVEDQVEHKSISPVHELHRSFVDKESRLVSEAGSPADSKSEAFTNDISDEYTDEEADDDMSENAVEEQVVQPRGKSPEPIIIYKTIEPEKPEFEPDQEIEYDFSAEPELAEYIQYSRYYDSRIIPDQFIGKSWSHFDQIYLELAAQFGVTETNIRNLSLYIQGQAYSDGDSHDMDDVGQPDKWRLSDGGNISYLLDSLTTKIRKLGIQEKTKSDESQINQLKISLKSTAVQLSRINELIRYKSGEINERGLRLRSLSVHDVEVQRSLRQKSGKIEEDLHKIESEINVLKSRLSKYGSSTGPSIPGIKQSISRITELATYRYNKIRQLGKEIYDLIDKNGYSPNASLAKRSGGGTSLSLLAEKSITREEVIDEIDFISKRAQNQFKSKVGQLLRQRDGQEILKNNPIKHVIDNS